MPILTEMEMLHGQLIRNSPVASNDGKHCVCVIIFWSKEHRLQLR